MKAKKYWILVIVSFSILIVLWPAQQITGETGLSAKEKKGVRRLIPGRLDFNDLIPKVPTESDSNLIAIRKLAASAKPVWVSEKEVLQGLEGVHVLVGDIKPEVEKYGLTKKALQTDTELQLRQYGIKVLTEEEWRSTQGQPWLCINVIVSMEEEVLLAGAAINVELRENVLLLREPATLCFAATTWSKTGVWGVGLGRIKDLRGSVKDFVSEFINDYLAANPKESEAKSKNNK